MYGDEPTEAKPPKWMSTELLEKWINAEKDATNRGSCKIHKPFYAETYGAPENWWPFYFPRMLPTCCASTDQVDRCHEISIYDSYKFDHDHSFWQKSVASGNVGAQLRHFVIS